MSLPLATALLLLALVILAAFVILLAVRRGEDADRIFNLRLALDMHIRNHAAVTGLVRDMGQRLRALEDDLKRRQSQPGPYRTPAEKQPARTESDE